MKNLNETEIKYLAGLLDSDGYVSFNYVKGRVYLDIGIVQSVGYDRHNYMEYLAQHTGTLQYRATAKQDQKVLRIRKQSDLNKIVPRLLKHMVVKGKPLSAMYGKYTELRGEVLEDLSDIKQFVKDSRLNTGPVKPKKHPTWAWVAGYLDGDGHYNFSQKRGTARLEVCAHKTDLAGLELLHKAFGGSILPMNGSDNFRWFRNLGKRDSGFAIAFLKKMHNHSQFKKWKIEQILNFHYASRRD